jgi:hypothetical protein
MRKTLTVAHRARRRAFSRAASCASRSFRSAFVIGTPVPTIPMGLRILAIIFRALFIGALVAVTVRVSSPQSESLASVYETPGDLIRLALGFAVCLWIVSHLFMLPRTTEGYRTWVYLGLVVAPFAWVVAIVIW